MARGAVQIFSVAAKGTVEEARRSLIAAAKREHARIMSTEPRPTRFTREVDGVRGAREEQVRSGGIIRYRYPRLEEIVREAFDALFDFSPVLEDVYRRSHTLFVDGSPARNLAEWDGQGELAIMNPVPYSRKIEIGTMKMRVPGTDRVYAQAAQVLQRRFGNLASITVTFRGIVGGYSVNQARAASQGQPWWLGGGAARAASGVLESAVAKRHGKTAHNKAGARFPALVIVPRR